MGDVIDFEKCRRARIVPPWLLISWWCLPWLSVFCACTKIAPRCAESQ